MIETQNIIITYESNLKSLTNDLETATTESKQFEKATDQSVDASKDLEKQTKKTGTGFRGFSSILKGVAAAFSVAAIGNFIKDIAQLGIEAEQTRISFETFLGSADRANEVIAELSEFAGATPFETDQVLNAGKALLAFGIAAEDLVPSLKSIGDLSAGTGKDFNELAVIFGKARTQGVLFAEDINQLTEAGIPIIQEFAKQLGVSESQVKKLASEGQISFANLEAAFTSLTSEGGRFFDLTARQSQTVGGVISTLRSNVIEIGKAIGTALLPSLRIVTNLFSSLAEGVRNYISPTKDATEQTLDLQASFNAEIETLKNANFTQEERAKIIDEINTKYGEYLPNLLDEKASIDEITAAQEAANNVFRQKILFIALEEELAEVTKRGAQAVKDALVNERARAKNQAILSGAIKSTVTEDARATESLANSQILLKALRDENLEVAQNTPDAIEEVKKDFDVLANALGTTIDELFARFGAKPRIQELQVNGPSQKEKDKAAKELAKLLERQRKEEEAAAKAIQDLKIDLIDNEINRKIAKLRLDADREKEDAKGTAEQIADQRLLIELITADKIREIRSENLKDILEDAEQFLEKQRAGEEAELIETEQRATAAQQLELEKRRLIIKQNLANGLIDTETAQLQEQQLNLESLRVQLDQLEISAADRIAIKQQIADAEAKIEEDATEKTKQEIEERRKAVIDAATAVIGIAKDVTDARVAEIDRLISIQQDRVNESLKTAEDGNAEQVQLEEDRLNKLNEARERAAQRQRVIAAIEIATNSAVAVSQGIVATTKAFAEGNLVLGIATAVALAATVASSVIAIKGSLTDVGSFAKGSEGLSKTDGVATPGGGILIEAHKDEKIFTAKQSKEINKVAGSNKNAIELMKKGREAESMTEVTTLQRVRNISNLTNEQSTALKSVAIQEVTNTKYLQLQIDGLGDKMDNQTAELKTMSRKIGNMKNEVIIGKDGIVLIHQKYATKEQTRKRAMR